MTPRRERLPLAVLISGGGTTLKNLLDRNAEGRLALDVRLVVSSNPQAAGLDFSRQAGIPSEVVQRERFAGGEEFGAAVFERIRASGADLVVLGGFLKLLPIPEDFENRVINIHPALIPAFCGAGYYGPRVHRAVLEQGVKITGCTVHFVDNQYDHGPIILQRAVEVREDDTPETLQRRVFAVECEALPEAIRLYQAGRLRVEGSRVRVLPPES